MIRQQGDVIRTLAQRWQLHHRATQSEVSNSGAGLLGTLEFEVLAGFTGSTELVITQVQLKHVAAGEQILAVLYTFTITAGGGIASDFTGDGKVNLSDFFLFADAFGGTDPRYDLTGDGKVNLSDFFVFADAFGGGIGKLLALAEVYLGVPVTAQLDQNYPNPFNAETAISYWLPREGSVALVVFDLAGQRVRTLERGFMAAGRHLVNWDARNDRREAVGSGIYFYRLRTAVSVQTHKLLLLQ